LGAEEEESNEKHGKDPKSTSSWIESTERSDSLAAGALVGGRSEGGTVLKVLLEGSQLGVTNANGSSTCLSFPSLGEDPFKESDGDRLEK